jgi:hypothetical protein
LGDIRPAEGITQPRKAARVTLKRQMSQVKTMSDIPGVAAEPCNRCGVRGDVDCKHRKGAGGPPPAVARANYEKRRGPNLNSRWGKAGNPTASEFARYSEAAREALGLRKDK